ncbi:uncharacterized protein LOC106645278 [Copidosoma floridanum]|uniref:uncharacterized protein LOC106645278 n=1 Tax=Copidosoma floridanum TaxID=29053 RepID=UPI0006C986FD|nr:uncharacterized protein LOC106645278 [Copidosoma floridanum]
MQWLESSPDEKERTPPAKERNGDGNSPDQKEWKTVSKKWKKKNGERGGRRPKKNSSGLPTSRKPRYQPRRWDCQVWSPTGCCVNSSEEMALIQQVNLDRTVLAHDLLDQFFRARGVDILSINEPSLALPGQGWYCDRTRGAAILIRSDKISVSDTGGGDGFVWIRCESAFYVSCYISPNISIGTFGERLSELEDAVRVCRESGDVVLARDFNSKAVAWGEPRTDPRGRAVLEMAARLDLIVMNSGGSATFRQPGNRGTIIDLMLVSSEMAARVSAWQVLEDYTASYHQYGSSVAMVSMPPPADWNKITNSEEAETLVRGTTRRVKEWCDACMPKRSAEKGRRSCYWWTEDIANLRREVSKNRCWCKLIAEVKKDTWGLAYGIALKRLRGTDLTLPMEPSFLERVVSCLFPEHPARRRADTSVGQVLLFMLDELRSVASETPGQKAPGPDGVPSEVLKIIAAEKPHLLLDILNACLRVKMFSEWWKIQRLVLLDKGKPPPLVPSSFRP